MEPHPQSVLAARFARAFPFLSPYACASLAAELQRIERAQRRHATRCCNGAPDVRDRRARGELHNYVKLVKLPAGRPADPTAPKGMTWQDDETARLQADQRILSALERFRDRLQQLGATKSYQHGVANWPIERQNDPRGAVLLIQLPGEADLSSVSVW